MIPSSIGFSIDCKCSNSLQYGLFHRLQMLKYILVNFYRISFDLLQIYNIHKWSPPVFTFPLIVNAQIYISKFVPTLIWHIWCNFLKFDFEI